MKRLIDAMYILKFYWGGLFPLDCKASLSFWCQQKFNSSCSRQTLLHNRLILDGYCIVWSYHFWKAWITLIPIDYYICRLYYPSIMLYNYNHLSFPRCSFFFWVSFSEYLRKNTDGIAPSKDLSYDSSEHLLINHKI